MSPEELAALIARVLNDDQFDPDDTDRSKVADAEVTPGHPTVVYVNFKNGDSLVVGTTFA